MNAFETDSEMLVQFTWRATWDQESLMKTCVNACLGHRTRTEPLSCGWQVISNHQGLGCRGVMRLQNNGHLCERLKTNELHWAGHFGTNVIRGGVGTILPSHRQILPQFVLTKPYNLLPISIQNGGQNSRMHINLSSLYVFVKLPKDRGHMDQKSYGQVVQVKRFSR